MSQKLPTTTVVVMSLEEPMSAYDRAQAESQALLDTALPCREAQAKPVQLLPALLCQAEIEEVIQLAEELSDAAVNTTYSDCAPGAHKTTFLHLDGLFQSRIPHVYAKLRDACLESDLRGEWGLVRNTLKDWDGIPRLRCVEYHKYTAGGSLMDKHHYDEGSLMTLDVMLATPSEVRSVSL